MLLTCMEPCKSHPSFGRDGTISLQATCAQVRANSCFYTQTVDTFWCSWNQTLLGRGTGWPLNSLGNLNWILGKASL